MWWIGLSKGICDPWEGWFARAAWSPDYMPVEYWNKEYKIPKKWNVNETLHLLKTMFDEKWEVKRYQYHPSEPPLLPIIMQHLWNIWNNLLEKQMFNLHHPNASLMQGTMQMKHICLTWIHIHLGRPEDSRRLGPSTWADHWSFWPLAGWKKRERWTAMQTKMVLASYWHICMSMPLRFICQVWALNDFVQLFCFFAEVGHSFTKRFWNEAQITSVICRSAFWLYYELNA